MCPEIALCSTNYLLAKFFSEIYKEKVRRLIIFMNFAAEHRFAELLQRVLVSHEIIRDPALRVCLNDSFDILSIPNMTEDPSNLSERERYLAKFSGKL